MRKKPTRTTKAALGALAALALLAGCAPPAPPASVLARASAGAHPLIAAEMPWPGGGPMLWSLPWNSGARNAGGWNSAVIRYGFLDESAREVVAPLYLRFDYCLRDGRPAQVVAAREGAIDVLAMDGSVTRTITTSVDVGGLMWRQVWCNASTTVAVLAPGGWDQYDLATGTRLPDKLDAGVVCEADRAEPPLPDGYPSRELGGWASDADSQNPPTKYINLQTSAVVTPPPTMSCDGDAGYLNCQGRLFDVVYDSRGQLTDFATVVAPNMGDCNGTRMPERAYLWAVAGGVQGYIDDAGAWRYQESRYQAAGD